MAVPSAGVRVYPFPVGQSTLRKAVPVEREDVALLTALARTLRKEDVAVLIEVAKKLKKG